MSNVENITKVYLLNVPLESDYKHTLYFTSKDEQYNYFESKIKYAFTDFTYQRKDNTIRIPKHYDEVYTCNYVMYKNQHYSNKWFYAFITNVEYINEDVSLITIETDVMQTWLLDYNFKSCFVEREHVNDDTIGANTIPENLEMGEYVCSYKTSYAGFTNLNIVVGITEYPKSGVPQPTAGSESAPSIDDDDWNQSGGAFYYGTYSGLRYYVFPLNVNGTDDIDWMLAVFAKSGKNDAVVNMFLAPSEISEKEFSEDVYNGGKYNVKTNSWFAKSFEIDRSYESDYIPKNNKLNCYPYKYLLASNNNGGSAIYQWEQFNDAKPTFRLYGTLAPGCSIRMIPLNYKKCAENDEEGLNLGKFPICNWTSDVYTNWLTQNGVNIGLNLISGLGQIVGGTAVAIATGGAGIAVGGSQIVSGVSSIANQLAQVHQMDFTPPQSQGNTNNGDIITVSQRNTFYFYGMTIKDEYLKIIDEFFSMYGYKTNRVKVPFKNHRKNYWFTKTIDCNITGDIPNKDLLKIKDCYNNGITFWKDASKIKDYSVDNGILG